jgi:NAD(P)-dependent dehydrogenase (short-subunit alcohol dehydrogenase family)
MACELGEKKIRVNSLSPGHIYTRFVSRLIALQYQIMMACDSMTAAYLDKQPHLFDVWSSMNPLGRLGRPDELRGVVTWLASDASTFCTGSE